MLDDLITHPISEHYVTRSRIMSALVAELHEDSFFDDVYSYLIHSLNFALLLNYYDSPRSVHARWDEEDKYEVFFDHCGTDNDFYGDFTVVSRAALVQTIKDYLLRLKKETADSDDLAD